MKYDVVISLGEWCFTSMGLRKHGLQFQSLPFDWSAGILWNKSGHGGLSGKVDLICNDFDSFFDFSDFDNRGPNPPTEEYWNLWVVNKRTGLQYKHDFPANVPFADSFNTVRDKYVRRIKRLRELIDSSDTILFVYFGLSVGFSDEYLIEQQEKLAKKFPSKRIDFLYLMNNPDYSEDDVHIDKLSENIKKVQFFCKNKSNDGASIIYPHPDILKNKHYINALKDVITSGRYETQKLRAEFIRTHFPNINKHFARIEYSAKLLYVIEHGMRFQIARMLLLIRKTMTTGEKQKEYEKRYKMITKLLADAKNSKQRFKQDILL